VAKFPRQEAAAPPRTKTSILETEGKEGTGEGGEKGGTRVNKTISTRDGKGQKKP